MKPNVFAAGLIAVGLAMAAPALAQNPNSMRVAGNFSSNG